MFYLKWEEQNVSAATRREDTDFGTILLDRVVPEALGGTSKRYFTDASYVFEISAPMAPWSTRPRWTGPTFVGGREAGLPLRSGRSSQAAGKQPAGTRNKPL